MKKIISILLILLILGGIGGYYYHQKQLAFLNETTIAYLGDDYKDIKLLNDKYEEVILNRGKEVKAKYNKEIIIDEINYIEIEYDNNIYYVLKDYLVDDLKDVIFEKELYVNKDQILYEDIDLPNIKLSLFEKDKLEVLGFDEIDDNGEVKNYYVSINGIEGYVKNKYVSKEYHSYAYDNHKYLALSDEEAISVKYYPKDDKAYQIENNIMPDNVNALYINAETIKYVDEYIDIANKSNINAFVIDIKDTHVISYNSDIVNKYSPSSGNGINEANYFGSQVKKLNDAGYYTIGRITVFKDPGFALDHQDKAIELNNEPYRYNSSMWPSIYQRLVWEYNISLALESIDLCQFNEIQFDYVRLPEYIPEEANMRNDYNETSIEAITHFINYATDVLHDKNVYVSIDVFGEVSGLYVTNYGQYWPAISNAADVISPMPYPDHFGRGYYGIDEPWKKPYELMYAWGSNANNCQNETYDPARLRTWIQVYDSVVDHTIYDSYMVKQQIDALKDLGINDGYITWNGAASYERFRNVIDAFK